MACCRKVFTKFSSRRGMEVISNSTPSWGDINSLDSDDHTQDVYEKDRVSNTKGLVTT
jgi:hypothetical protein